MMQHVVLTLRNKVGLHARPASVLVQTCARFKSNITVENATKKSPAVNAKSILGVLTLGAERGHEIVLTADGPDELDAIAVLCGLVDEGFGDPE